MASLANNLTLWILAGVCGVGLPLFGITYRTTYGLLQDALLEQAQAQVTLAQINLDYWLEEAAEATQVFANTLDTTTPNAVAIEDRLQRFVQRSATIYGATLATPPLFRIDPAQQQFAPLYYQIPTLGLQFSNLAEPRYDYLNQTWYEQARFSGQPRWTEPFFDAHGSGIQVMAYTVPIYFYQSVSQTRSRRQLFGVVAAQIALRDVQAQVETLNLDNHGFGIIYAQQSQQFIAHPQRELRLQGNLTALAQVHNQPELAAVATILAANTPGVHPFRQHNEAYWLVTAPLRQIDWTVGLVVSDRELTQALNAFFQRSLLAGSLGFGAAALLIAIIIRRRLQPLEALTEAAVVIAAGNLEAKVPQLSRTDEIGQLTHQFRHMKLSLIEQIQNLEQVTAAKQKLESELEIAHSIQMGMLPSVLEFTQQQEFSISCSLVSAKQVGGDLFDFFRVGRTLYFCIGDVSGKGVPAALFMARTITLIRAIATQNLGGPDVVLAYATQELARNNPELLFVTVFLGALDCDTGHLSAASAGHEMPFIIYPPRVNLTEVETGTPLGIDDDSDYELWQTHLAPGHTLLLYTDGLTEARNASNDEFSLARVQTVLEHYRHCPPNRIVHALKRAVAEFCGDTEPWDDITLLCFRFGLTHLVECQPMSVQWQVTLNGEPVDVNRLLPQLLNALSQAGLAASIFEDVRLVVEELVTNIIKYAYPATQTDRRIAIDYQHTTPTLSFRVCDNGVPFNPLEHIPNPDSFAADERPIGGLGIYLVQELSETVSYERTPNGNSLTVCLAVG